MKRRVYNKKVFLSIFVAIVLFFIFFSNNTALKNKLDSSSLYFLSPIYNSFYNAGNYISSRFSQSSDIDKLREENESLTSEVLVLKQRLSEYQEAKEENDELRDLLQYYSDQTDSINKVLGKVIGRDPENPAILILNIGKREGVEVNNAITISEGVMIAKVIEVYARNSKALLLTDSNSNVAVKLSGGLPTSKIARGEKGLSILLEQIPQGEIINEGQLVLTSGIEPRIPKGLVIGEVEEILSEENDLFQKAILKPLVDYSSVHFISVILSPS